MLSWASAPSKHPPLAWPNGRGEEIGTVDATIEEAWLSIRRHAREIWRPLRATEAAAARDRDGGAGRLGLMLAGALATPVTSVSGPEVGPRPLGARLDAAADPAPVRERLAALLPGLALTFHPAPAKG